MRYSRALIPTVKEAPSDAVTASHILLTRAGYVRRIGAGIYSFLPIGFRVLKKIEQIITGEMDRAGAQQVLLPALLPADYFKESGRWDSFGDTMMRLKDRKGGDYHLGPTHEEIICDMARREIKSYRDLPKNLYQVQTKYRDEARPRAGLLRCREFTMKDAYSFDLNDAGALESYETMRAAYTRIFDRTGLTYRMVNADSGAMGGSQSAEFQVLTQSGEDQIVACEKCDYAANVEVASVRAGEPPTLPSDIPARKQVSTPKKKTIEDVSKFLDKEPASFLKSLVVRADGELVMAVVRGDHELSETKLARVLGVSEIGLAEPGAVVKTTGAKLGFSGPVGFSGKVVIDSAVLGIADGVCGANVTDAHLVHVQAERDFEATSADIRNVTEGDVCPECGGQLKLYRGIEAGHIFVLGTHYSDKMGATYLDKEQVKRSMVMGCYGIGVSRLVAATVEQHHDDNGILWPMSIAPYQVHIAQLGEEPQVVEAVAKLEQDLEDAGIEVLIDDRKERPGVKFKDADLIGIPLRVTVGARSLKTGQVELKPRAEPNPKNAELIQLSDAPQLIVERVQKLLKS
ncbi:MAG: proline--tRNA ligase [Polyangiaceae bacterium]|nr:proline--tRNA ligase [Polyangiaceae bacterium]